MGQTFQTRPARLPDNRREERQNIRQRRSAAERQKVQVLIKETQEGSSQLGV